MFLRLRAAAAFSLGSVALALGLAAATDTSPEAVAADTRARYVPAGNSDADNLDALEAQWASRLSYPTGHFDPTWVRAAARQDGRVARSIPSGIQRAEL